MPRVVTREGDERVLHFVHYVREREEDGDDSLTKWHLDRLIREYREEWESGDRKGVTLRREYNNVKLNSNSKGLLKDGRKADRKRIAARGFFVLLFILEVVSCAACVNLVDHTKSFILIKRVILVFIGVFFFVAVLPRKSHA